MGKLARAVVSKDDRPHVGAKLHAHDLLPKRRSLETGLKLVGPGASRDHRESLSEVTSQDDNHTSHEGVVLAQVPECAVQSLVGPLVRHGALVPDDEPALLKEPTSP